MKGEAQIDRDRGRNLKGDGISQKCKIGRHSDCTAMRCKCTECDHGNGEIHIALPSGGTARVQPNITPERVEALDRMMEAVVKQVERDVFGR